MDVKAEIRGYLKKKLRVNVGDDEPLFELGLLDSIELLGLVAFIEEQAGVALPDEEILPENFETLDRIAAFVADVQSRTGA